MRKLVVLFASLVMFLVVFGALGFGQEKYTPKPNEELYGTWVNKEMVPQKMVKTAGLSEDYYPASATTPFRGAKVEIVKKWVDSEGNVYYATFDKFISGDIIGQTVESLWKVSKSGMVLEMNWHGALGKYDPDYCPKAIDPKASSYFIYYRAKE